LLAAGRSTGYLGRRPGLAAYGRLRTAGCGVLEPDGVLVAAGRQRSAVGAPIDGPAGTAGPAQAGQLTAGGDVPDAEAVGSGAGQPGAVGAPGDPGHPLSRPPERPPRAAAPP